MSRPMATSELVKDYVGRQLDALRVSFPATVQKYDPLTQTAEVMPDADYLIGTGGYIEAKPIADVPVCFPVGGGWEINWDIEKGDKVDCIVNDHSLAEWKMTGSSRVMQLKDPHGVGQIKAYPNLATRTQPRMQAGRGLYIGRSDGSVAIELTPTGQVKIGNAAVDLLAVVDQLADQILALTTAVVNLQLPVSGPVAGPVLPDDAAALTAVTTLVGTIKTQLAIIKGA